MRAVIQRVAKASVAINNSVQSSINQGLLILLGIENDDTIEDIEWLSGKISRLRIFNDEKGIMNLSVKDADAEVLLISQFTLHASTKKGNRPSYARAAKPDLAVPFYNKFILTLQQDINKNIKTGKFGAFMKISLVNDGPVTIIIDTKNKE